MKELLSAYVDKELKRTQREFVEEHLKQCVSCRELVAEYDRIGQQISTLRVVPLQIDIQQATISKIKSGDVPKIKQHTWALIGASALVVVLVIGMVFGLSLMAGKSSPAQAAEEIARNSEAFKFASVREGEVK